MTPSSHALALLRTFLSAGPARPLVVLIGPTASGKTALSLELAGALAADGVRTEVVNADSRQFYRGCDIGTAKIRPDEVRGVPHHLLSVLDPCEPCSIAWFQDRAEKVIAEIRSRGSIPFLVGGSMLYVSAIVDGLRPLPSDPALRARLGEAYDLDGGEALHRELQRRDPDAAASIPRENKQYVLRALEIITLTGTTKASSLSTTSSSHEVLLLGLDPPKHALDAAIERRVQSMLDAGWIQEVRDLLHSGVPMDAPAMQSHGYREIAAWLGDGADPSLLPVVAQTIAQSSKRYAKRHRTWWRRDERVHWL